VDEVKVGILELLRRRGPLPIYRIAKELGLSYGAAQWHVFYLEREGLVSTYRSGNRRYAAISPAADALKIIKVEDVLRDVMLSLRAYGVTPDMTVHEAIQVLSGRAPHLAEVIKRMAEERYRREGERENNN
jgi:DNA-binding transcriptional ArsR family regulator